MKHTAILAGILFLLVGCNTMENLPIQTGSGQETGSGETNNSQDTTKNTESALLGEWDVQGKDVSVSFSASNYVIDAGCNMINGEYSVDEDVTSIEFAPGVMTMMACPDPIGQLESEMIQTFSQINAYEIIGETIEFSGDDVSLILVKPTNTELIGTDWQLSQILIEDGIVSDVLFETSTLNLSQSGALSGTAICNSLIGSYETSENGSISFGAIGLTKMLCASEEANSYEQKITTQLSQVTQYTILRNTLTLEDTNGIVKLVYTKN